MILYRMFQVMNLKQIICKIKLVDTYDEQRMK